MLELKKIAVNATAQRIEASGRSARNPVDLISPFAASAVPNIPRACNATLKLIKEPDIPRFCIRRLIKCIEKVAIRPTKDAANTADPALLTAAGLPGRGLSES